MLDFSYFRNIRAVKDVNDVHNEENCKSDDQSIDSFREQFQNDTKFSEKHEFEDYEKEINKNSDKLFERVSKDTQLTGKTNDENAIPQVINIHQTKWGQN